MDKKVPDVWGTSHRPSSSDISQANNGTPASVMDKVIMLLKIFQIWNLEVRNVWLQQLMRLFLYMQLFHFHLLEQFFHTGGSGMVRENKNSINGT